MKYFNQAKWYLFTAPIFRRAKFTQLRSLIKICVFELCQQRFKNGLGKKKRELQLLLHSLFFWKILHVRLEKKKVENLLFSAKMLWKPNSNFSAATLLLLHSRSENMSLETMSQFDKIFSLVATRIAMHLFGRKFCN